MTTSGKIGGGGDVQGNVRLEKVTLLWPVAHFEGDKIMSLFTRMRKPTKLRIPRKGANINIKGNFETDVQAAITYCIISHLFKTCVAKIHGKEDAGKKKKKPSLTRLLRIVLDHTPILFVLKEDSWGPKTF